MLPTFPRPVPLAALLIGALVVLPTPVRSQTTGTSCTYETCALRLEPGGWFSGPEVVRGSSGVEVAAKGPRRRAHAEFSAAMWWYNRGLAERPAASAPAP